MEGSGEVVLLLNGGDTMTMAERGQLEAANAGVHIYLK